MKIAYIRTSSKEQNLQTQRDAVLAAGAEKIYEEQVSGKNTKNRPQLSDMLANLRKGDEVIAQKLDRISRSLVDLHNIASEIKEKGASLNILDQQINTDTPTGLLLFNVLGSLAEFERSLIAERMAAGKKASGRYGGRPKATDDKQNKTIKRLYANGASLKDLSQSYNCSKMTIWRIVKKYKSQGNPYDS